MHLTQLAPYNPLKHKALLVLLAFIVGVTVSVNAQNKIKGKVLSMSSGKPLANIEVKQHEMASEPTYTDSIGGFEYEIASAQSAVLSFAYAGYKTLVQYIAIKDEVTILLVPASEYSVDDEIAVPLSKLKDKYFTGAKSYVNQNDLNKQIYPSIDSRLSGMVSGVRVLPTSGTPGAGSNLLIRGISTINGGTQPLYVIDGLILRNYQYSNPLASGANHNPLSDLNPNDIKSINVIKDGAQSSFYGVRGANGVVVIETNMGTSGKTELSIDAYTGISVLPKELPVLNSNQYKTYFKDLNYTNGMSPYQFGEQYGAAFYNNSNREGNADYNNKTNWQQAITGPAITQNYYLNLKGGDQVTTYAFSTGYLNQQGVVSNTSLNRFNINFNLIYRISDKLRFGNVVNFTYADKSITDEGLNVNSNPLFISTIKAPQFAVKLMSADGKPTSLNADQDFFGMSNPSHILSEAENEVGINRLMGSVYLEADLAKNLLGRVEMGVDYNRQTESRFYPDYGLSTSENADRYSESKVNNRFLLQADAYLKYHKRIKNDAKLNIIAGVGVYNQSISNTYGKSINSAADYFTTLARGYADSLSSGDVVTRMISSYGKVNYSYKDKYLVEANVRADGSSRFGENNRFGYFPGASLGWRISEEDFLKYSSVINELKLKVGYGVTGNDNIEDYAAYNTFMGAAYNLRGALKPVNLGNKELKWETTHQIDAGLQLLAARNRIGAEIDFYVKNTTDLFYLRELPSHMGYSGILDNLGDIKNTGVDLSLFFRPIDRQLRWDTRILVSAYKNTVENLPGGETSQSQNGFVGLAREGDPVGAFYGYNAIGLFDTQAEADRMINSPGYEPFIAGDVKFEDMTKDGVIDNNDMDIIGSPHPDFYGSFLNSLSYKGWNLDVNLTYSVGNDAYNTPRIALESMSNHFNQSTSVLRSWKKTGDAAYTNIPRMSLNDPTGNARNSSRWVEDASYLRLQTLGLSYTLKQSVLDKVKLNALTIYVKGQNLYTFSNYLGYAPDFVSGYNPLLYGMDAGAYPMPKTFLLGVKVGL